MICNNRDEAENTRNQATAQPRSVKQLFVAPLRRCVRMIAIANIFQRFRCVFQQLWHISLGLQYVFQRLKDVLELLQDFLELLKDVLELLKDVLELFKDVLELLKDVFKRLKDVPELFKDVLELLKDFFKRLKDVFQSPHRIFLKKFVSLNNSWMQRKSLTTSGNCSSSHFCKK